MATWEDTMKGGSCSKQNNGPLKHNFKHSRDTNVNLFGPNNTMDLISPTTPEDQQKGQQHEGKKNLHYSQNVFLTQTIHSTHITTNNLLPKK